MATKKKDIYEHVMIDLETLDTAVTGVILSIGAVRFNADKIDDAGFYQVVTVQSNLDEYRTISPSTLAWWMQQDKAAQAVFSDKNVRTLSAALDALRDWFNATHVKPDVVKVWSNGADFDIPMLQHAYGQQKAPWSFFNSRCFRTMKSNPRFKDVPKPVNKGAHNALFDAVAQAEHLQALWKAGA